jgi:hypothetical protein
LETIRAAFGDEPLDRERLRDYYEARKTLDEGIAREFGGDESTPHQTVPATFEEWQNRLFRRTGLTEGYGAYGRCEATAKTTGERCRQAAVGHHGKCHYHGGAPGSGIGESQRDYTRERIDALGDQVEEGWEENTDRADYLLTARAGGSADQV